VKKSLYQTHVWLATISAIPLFLWCISAVLHPLMVWTSPEPVVKHIETQVDPDRLVTTLSEALERSEIDSVTEFDLTSFGGNQFYRVKLPDVDERAYFDTQSGEKLEDGERLHAESLARQFCGDTDSPVIDVTLVERFEGEYSAASQFLPVWRVQFDRDDHMRAYVDLKGDRLATLINDQRSWLILAFQLFHSWKFPGLPDSIRLAGLTVFSFLALMGAISGLMVYLVMWRKFGRGKAASSPRGRLRMLHRSLGLTVSFALLIFSFSAFFHAIVQVEKQDVTRMRPAAIFAASDLDQHLSNLLTQTGLTDEIRDVSLIFLDSQSHYIVSRKPEERQHFEPVVIHAGSGTIVPEGDTHFVAQLAETYFGPSTNSQTNVSRLTSFQADYSPFYRRLPVARVARANGLQAFIDPTDGAVALSLTTLGGWEQLSFSFLHKWHFLNQMGLSRQLRDAIMVITVMCIAALSLTGGILLVLRWKR